MAGARGLIAACRSTPTRNVTRWPRSAIPTGVEEKRFPSRQWLTTTNRCEACQESRRKLDRPLGSGISK
ncbi:MAG: hypothetical protein WCF24_11055 [Acidimicrobiales bacterium]